MKRILVISLVVFGVVAFAASAGAQNMLGTIELNGGYAKPSTEVSPNNDSWGGGITFGAAYWRPMSPQISWGAELSYDNMGSVDYDTGTSTATYSGHVLRVNPAMRFSFGAPVGPSFFAQGGAGLYSVAAKYEDSVDPSLNTDASDSKFGFNVGAGVNFPVGPKTKLNFQGTYHSISTDNQSTNYIQVRCGVGFGL
ncbi:MAG TPA: outer membrane beta-barrel protein [Candidatus Eisenbacteria bacterium]|jgi:opacity protein-like surface antigen